MKVFKFNIEDLKEENKKYLLEVIDNEYDCFLEVNSKKNLDIILLESLRRSKNEEILLVNDINLILNLEYDCIDDDLEDTQIYRDIIRNIFKELNEINLIVEEV